MIAADFIVTDTSDYAVGAVHLWNLVSNLQEVIHYRYHRWHRMMKDSGLSEGIHKFTQDFISQFSTVYVTCMKLIKCCCRYLAMVNHHFDFHTRESAQHCDSEVNGLQPRATFLNL